ncbi:hypothetical protein [Streptomyces sp. NPDC054786]
MASADASVKRPPARAGGRAKTWVDGEAANRTAMPKWKNGDVAACRECVGYRVSHTFPECGHTATVRALAPFGQEAMEPTGGQVGVAAEVR